MVRLKPPLMMPVRESAPVLTPCPGPLVVMVRLAASVSAPGSVSPALPPKVTSAPHVIKPAVVPVIAAPEVLLIVPPLRATVPVAPPSAAAALTLTVPAERTKAPVRVFAPVSVKVPLPALVRPKVPDMTPPTCKDFAVTVMMRAPPRATLPVPRLSESVPANVKSAFQAWTLLVRIVWAWPLVLSIVTPPAPPMVNVPVPKAEFVEEVPPVLR